MVDDGQGPGHAPVMSQSPGVAEALGRLAALAYEQPRRVDTLISDSLTLIADSLKVGLVFLSRVDGDSLHIEGSYDPAAMGMQTGDVVPLCDTY